MDGARSTTPAGGARPGAPWVLAGTGALVLVIAVAGFVRLARYGSRPGAPAQTSMHWDADDLLELAADRPTLLLFSHPQCPCTRATIEQLDRIAARSDGRLHVIANFVALPGRESDWVHDDLWDRAEAIPGVAVREDAGGALARRLGVVTSGQALLYAADGRLLFQGGITPARGHLADHVGAEAIVDVAMGRDPRQTSTPVFGCSLGCGDEMDEGGMRPWAVR